MTPLAGVSRRVVRVPLVRQAEHQHPGASHRLPPFVQTQQHALDHVGGHVVVDVVRNRDEAGRFAELTLDLPRQVRRVDGKAVPADSRAWVERHVAEWLRTGGVDDLPDVDTKGGGVDRQFVHECDVHVTERVLQQLRQLGLTGAFHDDRDVDERCRRTPAPPSATRGRHPIPPSVCAGSSSCCYPDRCAPGNSRGGSRGLV